MYFRGTGQQITAAVAERLISLDGTRNAVPVTPMPGEGLADLIYRAACENGFRYVRSMFPDKARYSHSSFAVNQLQLPGVAEVLCTPHGDRDLEPLYYRRWSEAGRWVNFFGAALPSRQFSGKRRVSPFSLQHEPWSKAVWHLNALTFDPRYHEMLLEACPVCGTNFNFIDAVGLYRCHSCGPKVDLRDFRQPIVDCDDTDALNFATGLVDPENQNGKAGAATLHPAIRGENPGHLFTLCVLIATIFEKPQYESGRRLIASANLEPKNLAKASRAVLNWPNGLAEILSDAGTFRSANENSDGHSFAGICKYSGVLAPALMTAVQQVVMLARIGAEQPRFLRRLEVTATDLSREEVSEFAQFSALSTTGPFLEAVTRTNLPPIVLYNCYLSGICGPKAAHPSDIGPQVLYWASDLNFKMARQTAKTIAALSVKRFVASFALSEGDVWPLVIKAILDGVLPVKRKPKAGQLVDALYVDSPDVWIDFLRGAKGITESNRFPLSSPEVAFLLDMSVGAAQTLFDFKKKVTHCDLQTFRREYLLLDHLSCIAATQGERLNREALYRKLNAAGLRSRGDRFVSRKDALDYFQLI